MTADNALRAIGSGVASGVGCAIAIIIAGAFTPLTLTIPMPNAQVMVSDITALVAGLGAVLSAVAHSAAVFHWKIPVSFKQSVVVGVLSALSLGACGLVVGFNITLFIIVISAVSILASFMLVRLGRHA